MLRHGKHGVNSRIRPRLRGMLRRDGESCNEFVVCVVCSVSVFLSSVKPCYNHVSDNILNSFTDAHHDGDPDTRTWSDH